MMSISEACCVLSFLLSLHDARLLASTSFLQGLQDFFQAQDLKASSNSILPPSRPFKLQGLINLFIILSLSSPPLRLHLFYISQVFRFIVYFVPLNVRTTDYSFFFSPPLHAFVFIFPCATCFSSFVLHFSHPALSYVSIHPLSSPANIFLLFQIYTQLLVSLIFFESSNLDIIAFYSTYFSFFFFSPFLAFIAFLYFLNNFQPNNPYSLLLPSPSSHRIQIPKKSMHFHATFSIDI